MASVNFPDGVPKDAKLIYDNTSTTSKTTSSTQIDEIVVTYTKSGVVEQEIAGDIPSEKTDGVDLTRRQKKNLKKLEDARNFLKSEEGTKLSEHLLEQKGKLYEGQRGWLKQQGIDPDIFVSEWNKANPDAEKDVIVDQKEADKHKEKMGTIANSHLDTGNIREAAPERDDSIVDDRTFVQKLGFKKKNRQKISADAEHGFNTATKVKIHSTAELGDNNSPDLRTGNVADDMANEGEQYLESFKESTDGSRRKTFKEIDENGNVKKTVVRYRKDGSVKKVITKSDTDGKLKVTKQRDGDITIKGNLQSDKILVNTPESTEIGVATTKTVTTETDTNRDRVYLKTVVKKVPEPTPQPTPEPKPTVESGLINDHVNTLGGGVGNIQGSEVVNAFKEQGASYVFEQFCNFNDQSAPAEAKRLWGNSSSPAEQANRYNARHIVMALINDEAGKKPDEESLASFITELHNRGESQLLKDVRDVIETNNNSVLKINPNDRHFDPVSKSSNQLITNKQIPIAWLMQTKSF